MKKIILLILPLLLFANLFDSQEFAINNYGQFVISKDKKSFYSEDLFSFYQVKQIDINTTKVIAKYKRYKDIDLKSDDEKLVRKVFPNKFKKVLDELIYCVDRKKSIIYYANKLNQIVAYDYKLNKEKFTSETLLVIEEYSTIKAIRLLKDSSKLLVALDDTLAIFDAKTKTTKSFGIVSRSVQDVAISPSFKYIVVSDIRHTMKIYDYETKSFIKKLDVKSHGFKESFHADIDTIKFLDDDKLLYASSLEGVQLLSINSGKVIREYREHKLSPRVLIRGNTAYFITSEARVYQYDLQKDKFIEVYALPLKEVKRVVSNGKSMLISQRDGKFIWYDLKSNRYKDYHKSFRDHFTASYDFHPSKLQFARVSSNHAMQIFDIKSGKEIVRIENKIFDIAEIFSFLDDDIILYSSNFCRYENKPPLVLIDTKRERVHFFRGHLDTISRFMFLSDKQYLITASYDRTIKLWKIDLENLRVKELDTLYTGNIPYDISLSDDEKSLAISTQNGDLYIYGVDLQKQRFTKLKKVLEGKKPSKTNHTARKRTDDEKFNLRFYTLNARYYNLRFYDNDTKLIAKNHQSNVIFYDLKRGKKLHKLLFFNQRDWVKLYPNGKFESSKNGYKYIDDKLYDIFKEDRLVLENTTPEDRGKDWSEILDNKFHKDKPIKTKEDKKSINLPLWGGIVFYIVIMILISNKKRNIGNFENEYR